ncbi:hypothetical protein BCR34DRAFT_631961 [Clohesyomyces aquaticus]|uniref:RTA1 like protein-domain-containing protein n=1 Tax=Clohesyomyces aquaticus TaxID=1231657 RepID=A0A1Y1ZA82_9PLEO|nr:hypothetical protein BCR34DRAFT_631961 [Clohesyomyces aquaticus]
MPNSSPNAFDERFTEGFSVPGSVYIYAPNKIAPVFFAAAFAASGLVHLWQCYHYKCFRWTSYHWMCCTFFVAGFGCREYGAFNYDNLPVYIASQCFIYFSPPILELANYHVLGHVLFYGPYFAPFHPGRILSTFGFVSFIVEITNAIGVSYSINTALPKNLIDLGHTMMKVSLILQIVVITLFVLLAAMTHRRSLKDRFEIRSVEGPLLTLYVSTAIILVRTIYRAVEHFAFESTPAGLDFDAQDLSPMLRYEWFFYVFEASLMLVNEVWWNLRHPRRYLPEDFRVYLAQDGVTEVQGPGWDDGRNWIVTFLDPFGWVLKNNESKEGKQKKFWESDGHEAVELVSSPQRSV